MGSQRPETRASWADAGISTLNSMPLELKTLRFSMSMVISTEGSASTSARSLAMFSALATTHGMARVVELPKKISAKDSAMTPSNPYFLSDCGACSREEPQPKLTPARRMRRP